MFIDVFVNFLPQILSLPGIFYFFAVLLALCCILIVRGFIKW